jgi:Fe2+-dicitrate sensor, membrane component
MNRVVRLKSQAQIDDEAATWTWRLDSGTLSAAERAEFENWLRRDSRHRRAFDEFSKTWRSLDRLSEIKRDEKIATLARATRRWTGRRQSPKLWIAAATLCLGVIGAAWFESRPHSEVYSTIVGQERTVTLADGSVVALNTNTRIKVQFSRRRRVIYLLKGQAHFHDVPERTRPFYVLAGNARVQAIGTRFEVRVRAHRLVDVLVNQGLVEVQAEFGHSSAVPQMQSLKAGQRLAIDGRRMRVTSISPGRVVDDLSWRYGALVFNNEPLARATAEVARYTHAHIVLRPGVGQLRISGRFKTDDVRGFFKALALALPVQVNHIRPNLITIGHR